MKTLNNSSVESTVDVKILNQKIFALIVMFDAFSKNSLVSSHVKNIAISIAMNMSSLEHLINENDFAIETFDIDIEMNASLKNSLIQKIENFEISKKNSIYIYELFALSIFNLNIDIDFDFYIIDIETIKFLVMSFYVKKQTSCKTFCELAVFSVFDLNIDIDFEIYKTNIETKSFD